MAIYTFSDCQKIINLQVQRGFDKKKLANNTYLRRLSDQEYAISLHSTDVIVIFESNGQTCYRLNSGGYQTVTTKDRLNTFSPARIYQKRGVWYLNEDGYTGDGKSDLIYFDGIEIDVKGKAVNANSAPTDYLEKKKALDRLINEYIRGFAKDAIENELGVPNGGDCWLCHMYLDHQEKDDLVHVCSHLYEKYYTRAFLYYCLRLHNYRDCNLIWAMISADCKKGKDDWLKRELRYGFSKMKDRLMKVFSIDEYQAVLEERRELASVS